MPSDIRPVSLIDEMKRSYLDYAMSVIVSRALPDVRDGLKPVHRRILYAMQRLGLDFNKKHMKSSKVVGDTMGDFHPHGNLAIYDALVRMAQEFSMRLPLIDGQGNFGSVDGDPPAAERYTEARLSKIAQFLLDDLDKDTVDFKPNYDDRLEEPSVLPAKFPNLLVNGAGGIAVGMATNIPPHNLGEVIDACIAYLDNPAISIDELAELVPGPDFPTGGMILGKTGIRSAYHKGRGSDRDARAGAQRDRPQGARGAHHHRDSLSGEQGGDGREDRRICAREEDRGHLRHPRRIRPPGHARGDRAEARRHGRCRAEPALPLLRAADHVRLQHRGADRRQARAAQPQGPDQRLHRVPRGGGRPPHQVPAAQGARAGAYPGRPRHRRRQYRRDHQADPHRARPDRRRASS